MNKRQRKKQAKRQLELYLKLAVRRESARARRLDDELRSLIDRSRRDLFRRGVGVLNIPASEMK